MLINLLHISPVSLLVRAVTSPSEKLYKEFIKVFAPAKGMPPVHDPDDYHQILLLDKDSTPPARHYYRLSPAELDVLQEQINKMFYFLSLTST